MNNEISRRHHIDQFTPEERAIYVATVAVEAMPADLRLTHAVTLLQEARYAVADFVDDVESRPHADKLLHAAAGRTYEAFCKVIFDATGSRVATWDEDMPEVAREAWLAAAAACLGPPR